MNGPITLGAEPVENRDERNPATLLELGRASEETLGGDGAPLEDSFPRPDGP